MFRRVRRGRRKLNRNSDRYATGAQKVHLSSIWTRRWPIALDRNERFVQSIGFTRFSDVRLVKGQFVQKISFRVRFLIKIRRDLWSVLISMKRSSPFKSHCISLLSDLLYLVLNNNAINNVVISDFVAGNAECSKNIC